MLISGIRMLKIVQLINTDNKRYNTVIPMVTLQASSGIQILGFRLLVKVAEQQDKRSEG